jgi:hypothetical protein
MRFVDLRPGDFYYCEFWGWLIISVNVNDDSKFAMMTLMYCFGGGRIVGHIETWTSNLFDDIAPGSFVLRNGVMINEVL